MRGSASTLPPPITRRPSHPSGIDPISPVTERGGGGTGWIQIARAKNDIEAHLLAGRLGEAGIETSCLKDRSMPGAWLHGGSNPWDPVAVFVKKVQADDARIVLAEISWAQPSVEPVTPGDETHAGRSDRLDYRRKRMSYAFTWWVAAIALGLLFTSIALARTGEALHGCELPLVCAENSGPAGD